jgi:putative endonuclease
MSGFLYVLCCSDRSYYVGSTSNLDFRVAEHQMGLGGDYTSRRRPLEVVFTEEFSSVHEAFLAEREVKGWSRKKKEALIRRDYAALPELSWSTVKRAEEHVLRQPQDASQGGSIETSAQEHVLRRAQDGIPGGSVETGGQEHVLRQAQDAFDGSQEKYG